MYSLSNTSSGYNLSWRDMGLSAATLFSGAPYGIRHWEYSKEPKNSSSSFHKVIACIEMMPILGLIVAIIERIVARLHAYLFQTTTSTKKIEIERVSTPANPKEGLKVTIEGDLKGAGESELKVAQEIPEPIIYEEGQKLVPTKKAIIKKSGISIHIHAKHSDRIVKKYIGEDGMTNPKEEPRILDEYRLGARLNHPNIVKIRQLYIKSFPNSGQKLYEIVMDKARGVHPTKGLELSVDAIEKLIRQGKDCCLYLFDNLVVWGDLNRGNIFIDQERLTLIDLGQWAQIPDSILDDDLLTMLLGAMELVSILVLQSKTLKIANKDIVFPENFYSISLYKKILKSHSDKYEEIMVGKWGIVSYPVFATKFRHFNLDKSKQGDPHRNFLSDYFDAVLKEITKVKLASSSMNTSELPAAS